MEIIPKASNIRLPSVPNASLTDLSANTTRFSETASEINGIILPMLNFVKFSTSNTIPTNSPSIIEIIPNDCHALPPSTTLDTILSASAISIKAAVIVTKPLAASLVLPPYLPSNIATPVSSASIRLTTAKLSHK